MHVVFNEELAVTVYDK